MTLDFYLTEITAELDRALAKHGNFNSTHEALGVILEEFEELKEAIKNGDEENGIEEAVQLAAMCVKLLLASDKLVWK